MYRDIYQEVTDTIIRQLEQGQAPWRKPWDGGKELTMPANKVTGKHYRGINIPILWMAAEQKDYNVNQWASFNQWSEVKQSVAKGEKGTTIVYYDTLKRQEDEKEVVIPYIKTSVVFNCCQLKGYDPEKEPTFVNDKFESLSKVEQFITNTQAMVFPDGGDRAYYNWREDAIHMPLKTAFKDLPGQTATEAYYSTNLHELIHWTAKPERVDRKLSKRFEIGWYAMEELVAEMGAAFMCADLQITDGQNVHHAQYLHHWLDVMKEDKKAIFTAASAASKACDFLHSLQSVKQIETLEI